LGKGTSRPSDTENDTLHTSGLVGSTRDRKLIEPGNPKMSATAVACLRCVTLAAHAS
jgi:hypothetical protein